MDVKLVLVIVVIFQMTWKDVLLKITFLLVVYYQEIEILKVEFMLKVVVNF